MVRRAGARARRRRCPRDGSPGRPGRAASGSPSRITLRAAVPIASASARATCPASSMTSVSRGRAVEIPAREEPRRAGHELGAGGRRHELVGVRDIADRGAAYSVSPMPAQDFFSPRTLTPRLARPSVDLVEQVVDRLVARGRDADAPAAADEIDHEPGARPRLAGAGRPLDEEIARVERGGAPRCSRQIDRLHRPAEPAGESRPRPRQDVLAARGSGRCRPASRRPGARARALRVRLDGPRRDERRRKRTERGSGPSAGGPARPPSRRAPRSCRRPCPWPDRTARRRAPACAAAIWKREAGTPATA